MLLSRSKHLQGQVARKTTLFQSPPKKAFERTYHSVPLPEGPTTIELDNLQWGRQLNGPRHEPAYAEPSGTETPIVTDLEMSRPTTPVDAEQDGVDTVQSFSNPPMNRFRMVSVCLLNFSNGLNDSAPGALIPYIEKWVSQSSVRIHGH